MFSQLIGLFICTDQHRDIQVLKTYGAAPYAAALKKLEQQIKEKQTSVNEKIGVKVFCVKRTGQQTAAHIFIGIRYWISTTSSLGCRRR
jgi:hypothetical protein